MSLIKVVLLVAQLKTELRELVREFSEQAYLLQQWFTLVTSSIADAGPEQDTKNVASMLADMFCSKADIWMQDPGSYNKNRADIISELGVS